ncbi:HAD-IIB family hydrolase [Mycoplasma parvum]|uniref:Haloacid dehalogenase n=1 Tax=Mycoplasma parvum str. Indiana TaxID=1403316 RepID=U5NC85_9MOLU|nr:HAD family hydrolase [Mycoplasma parvum]AGX89191.1 haloacid dehalogenase [Mycoplasma parvum str. Indiana]
MPEKKRAQYRTKIRVLFTDLDGTLLSPKPWLWGKVRTHTLSILGSFLDKGENHLILATGRNITRAKAIAEWLEDRLGGYKIPYLICLNGGTLVNNETGKIIYSKTFKVDKLWHLIKFVKSHFLVSFLVFTSENILYTENDLISKTLAKKFAKKYGATVKYVELMYLSESWNNIQKVMIITLHKNSEKLRAIIESKFSEFYVSTHGGWLLEVIDRKINKFFAIEEILKREKSWKLSECCGVGNEGNDILMIEQCGYGVAVDFHSKKTFKYKTELINFYTTNKDGKAISRVLTTNF